jgi:hypothetical protein
MHLVRTSYGNSKSQEYDGFRYMSRFEASYAQQLNLRLRAKEIASWERQVTIPLIVNDYRVCNYIIDFIIHHKDGTLEYVETKGFATEVWKLKWKLFEALYSEKPGVTLTVVMQGKNKPPKAKKLWHKTI